MLGYHFLTTLYLFHAGLSGIPQTFSQEPQSKYVQLFSVITHSTVHCSTKATLKKTNDVAVLNKTLSTKTGRWAKVTGHARLGMFLLMECGVSEEPGRLLYFVH